MGSTTHWNPRRGAVPRFWGSLEYRHDDADKLAFKAKNGVLTDKQQDTLAIAVYYAFF
jgi:hypothetical protein